MLALLEAAPTIIACFEGNVVAAADDECSDVDPCLVTGPEHAAVALAIIEAAPAETSSMTRPWRADPPAAAEHRCGGSSRQTHVVEELAEAWTRFAASDRPNDQ